MSDDRTINVVTKHNIVKRNDKIDSIHSEFTLQYVIITDYYIVNDMYIKPF